MPPLCAALAFALAATAAADDGDLAVFETEESAQVKALTKDPAATAKRLVELRASHAALSQKVRPLLDDIDNLAAAYPVSRDLDALFTRRLEVGGKLYELSGKIYLIEVEYGGLAKGATLRSLTQMLGKGFKGQKITPGMEITNTVRIDEFHREMKQLREAMEVVTERENAAYLLAKQGQDDRRALRRSLLLGAGAALAGVLVALAGWRLLKPPEIPVTHPLLTVPREPLPPAAGTPRLAGPTDALAAGTVLDGAYRVEREVGRGGMGVVFEARDLNLNRAVAIKRVRRELSGESGEFEQLLREAQTVAALKHPNIVQIHTIFREQGALYLVFEFVEGRPLSQWLGPERRLQFAQARSVLRQIAAALDYAHGRRVIHRDLKPANIMIEKDGTAKVMDFGIAHQSRQTAAVSTQALAWGTPAYMAPEQELGEVSRASDLFALGAVFYEMLVGVPPFMGPNYLAQKRERVWRAPTAAAPGLPAGVDAVIARILAPDPAARFPDAKSFSDAVRTLA